jgi:hypothetical protein
VHRGRTWPGGHGPSPGGLRPSTSARACPGAPPLASSPTAGTASFSALLCSCSCRDLVFEFD